MKTALSKIGKVLYIILLVALIIFWVYVIASWLNVAYNNVSPEEIAKQWDWNFFELTFGK